MKTVLLSFSVIAIFCCTISGSTNETYGITEDCVERLIRPRDCLDIKFLCPTARSGVYKIFPAHSPPDFEGMDVPCDMFTQGGGWIVFQRRLDGGVKFSRDFAEYQKGFGELSGEFWLGLENLNLLTRGGENTLRIEMSDFEDFSAYATYQDFYIEKGDDFTLKFDNTSFFGDAGDSLSWHEGQKFSAPGKDQDSNPESDCAANNENGWWFNHCFESNLNGNYTNPQMKVPGWGIIWEKFRGVDYSLKETEMKFRTNY